MAAAKHKNEPLGKGLDALFGGDDLDIITEINSTAPANSGVTEIPLMDIEPNRNQPRKDFDADKLEALAQSIKEHGVVSPILVTPNKNGTYKIVAGERRWRASKLAGLHEIPCIVKDFDERKSSELALVENLQRDDLNPIEEAEGYKYLMDAFSLTQDEVAKKIGKSRSAVANSLRLNNLCPEVKEMLKEDKLTQGHARALLTLPPETQIILAEKIIEEGLTVRRAEALAQSAAADKPSSPKKSVNPMTQKYYKDLEDNLSSRFGTKVKISEGSKKGKIEIEYYSKDDLDRILFELRK